jgi:hypothetical protein
MMHSNVALDSKKGSFVCSSRALGREVLRHIVCFGKHSQSKHTKISGKTIRAGCNARGVKERITSDVGVVCFIEISCSGIELPLHLVCNL